MEEYIYISDLSMSVYKDSNGEYRMSVAHRDGDEWVIISETLFKALLEEFGEE